MMVVPNSFENRYILSVLVSALIKRLLNFLVNQGVYRRREGEKNSGD